MSAVLFPDLVVNGETVPQAVVAAEAQNHEAPKNKPGIAWRKSANAIAVRTLLLQEARRRGLDPQPAEHGPGRFETDEEALIRGLLEAVIEVSPPDEAAISAEWARNPSRFRAPPLWEVSHILCACDPRDEAQRLAAQVQAEALAKAVVEAPKEFARFAKEHSDCGSAPSGGVLGQLGPGDTVPEFEAAMRQLSEGEICKTPVLTRHGWHVIRMDAVALGAELPFDAVRPRIADALEKASWAKAARGFVAELVAASRIEGADLRTE